MAPVDPTDLLKAFKPLLTVLGGIKSVADVPRLSLLMKRYSKKLVSRCIYCNILLATTPDVLLCFLERDGWNLINCWLKESLDGNNYHFICELLDLLVKCPMSIARLKENDTPKLVKSLSKTSDKDVSEKAKLVVDKWKELIRLDRLNENVNNGNLAKKKRKKEKNVDDDEGDAAKIRKVKGTGGGILQQQASVNDGNNSSGDVTTTTKSSTAPKTTEEDANSDGGGNANRPKTAKISLGKSRSLGILEDANATSGKSKGSKKGDDGADKSGPGKSNKLNNKSADNPLSVSNSGPNSNSNATKQSSKPTLKESVGFIEDIVSLSSFTGQVRKRRKSDSKSKSSSSSGSNTAKDSVPDSSSQNDESGTVQEPMDTNEDTLDEMEEERITSASGDESNSNTNNVDESHVLPIVDIPDVDNLVIPEIEPTKLPGTKKSILSYIKKAGRAKKSVRWRSDERIKEIKYFELDETERTNVSKSNFGDFRANDIRNERQMMAQLRSNRSNSGPTTATLAPSTEKCITYLPWKLILIDLPLGLPLIESGTHSEERRIQAAAANNVLNADFFPLKEGAHEYYPKEPDLTESGAHSNDGPTVIPLDDENCTMTDFSSMPYPLPRNNEIYLANRGISVGPPMPGPQQHPHPGMGPRPPIPMNRGPFPPAGFVPPVSYGPYGAGPPGPPGVPPFVPPGAAGPGMMPLRPIPGRGPGFQPQRMDSGWPARPRGPPICRNFLKSGSCRFMARCNYLHQYPNTNNPHGPGSSSSSNQPHME